MVRFCWNLTGHLLETIAAFQFVLPGLRTVVQNGAKNFQ